MLRSYLNAKFDNDMLLYPVGTITVHAIRFQTLLKVKTLGERKLRLVYLYGIDV